MPRFDWRGWVARLAHLWRSSLQVRTVAITVVLSGLAVTIIGTYMSISIGSNLFETRKSQAITESERAVVTVQGIFDAAADSSTAPDLETANSNAFSAISRSPSSSVGTAIAIRRSDGQSGPSQLQNTATPGLDTSVISDDLRKKVANSEERRLYLQSVSLDADPGTDPGLVVGSVLDIPSAGQYELYLVYNFADAQSTLAFVQQTLLIGGLALVLLIGAVTWVVVRLVVGPIRIAAETSEKLAAGQLEERIPEKGEDVIATLARSFNGMADSMQRQITRLARLSQLQQRFVSDVSHELRTPLTTIRLAGDVLYDQRDTFPPTTARTAELLHTQVQRFEILLADLLEMSRYDAGAVQLDTEPTNLVRLVEEAIDSVSTLAVQSGSDLRLVAPGGYFEADVDSRRIRRILQNLLGNAIDHGEGRPIVVYVDSNATAVAIAVRDFGVGMTAAEAERVFDRFWRADPSRQRTTGGTGLGLAISLEDATLHDGWLELWSERGAGSCFRLTIPRVRGTMLKTSPLELPPIDPLDELEVTDA
jgi:two-component system, OmpR family, sensor histidine kinase MtrB